jgi:hypothetical protein
MQYHVPDGTKPKGHDRLILLNLFKLRSTPGFMLSPATAGWLKTFAIIEVKS